MFRLLFTRSESWGFAKMIRLQIAPTLEQYNGFRISVHI